MRPKAATRSSDSRGGRQQYQPVAGRRHQYDGKGHDGHYCCSRQRHSTGFLCFRCRQGELQLNSLWSVWYCAAVVAFEIYLTAVSFNRFTHYVGLPTSNSSGWHRNATSEGLSLTSAIEVHLYEVCVGTAVILLPVFAGAAIFKIGNLSNDGYKLGTFTDTTVLVKSPSLSKSSDSGSVTPRSPMSEIGETPPSPTSKPLPQPQTISWRSWVKVLWRTAWQHSGPTAPALHVISAFCLLIPKVLLQAKLIRNGYLSKEEIWRTDLDFIFPYNDRKLVLSMLSAGNQSFPSINQSSLPLINGGRNGQFLPIASEFVSAEFINYAIALLVYSVRYPSVFWHTNRAFGFLFSLQLVLHSVHNLFAFSGFTILYKLRVFGSLSEHNSHSEGLKKVLPAIGNEEFVLGRMSTVILYLTGVLVLSFAGNVIYFYGYQRFKINHCREYEKREAAWRESEQRTLWIYCPHFLAFIVLAASVATLSPILYDYTVAYKGSLDATVLASLTSTISYLFLWIVLWFALTLKQHWNFRVKPRITLSPLCNGQSPSDERKVGGDIELQKYFKQHHRSPPLLVISNGETFTVKESASKKAILSLLHRNFKSKFAGMRRSASGSSLGTSLEGDEEDIYWLKPKHPQSPSSTSLTLPLTPMDKTGKLWLPRKKSFPTSSSKQKVTFGDTIMELEGSPRRMRGPLAETSGPMGDCPGGHCSIPGGIALKSPHCQGSKAKKQCVKFEDCDSDDDKDCGENAGEYATLREEHMFGGLPRRMTKCQEGEDDDDGGSQSSGQEDDTLIADGDYEDPERECLLSAAGTPNNQIHVPVTVHDDNDQLTGFAQELEAGILLLSPDQPLTVCTTTSTNPALTTTPGGSSSSPLSAGIGSSSASDDNRAGSVAGSSDGGRDCRGGSLDCSAGLGGLSGGSGNGSDSSSSGIHSSSSIYDVPPPITPTSTFTPIMKALTGRGVAYPMMVPVATFVHQQQEPYGGLSSRKATSVNDLSYAPEHYHLQEPPMPQPHWKSLSLQRGGGMMIPAGMGTGGPVDMTVARNRHWAAPYVEGPLFERNTNMRMSSFKDDSPPPGLGSPSHMPYNDQSPFLISGPYGPSSLRFPYPTVGVLGHQRHILNTIPASPTSQRDSTNYSLASSGDSDSGFSHT